MSRSFRPFCCLHKGTLGAPFRLALPRWSLDYHYCLTRSIPYHWRPCQVFPLLYSRLCYKCWTLCSRCHLGSRYLFGSRLITHFPLYSGWSIRELDQEQARQSLCLSHSIVFQQLYLISCWSSRGASGASSFYLNRFGWCSGKPSARLLLQRLSSLSYSLRSVED